MAPEYLWSGCGRCTESYRSVATHPLLRTIRNVLCFSVSLFLPNAVYSGAGAPPQHPGPKRYTINGALHRILYASGTPVTTGAGPHPWIPGLFFSTAASRSRPHNTREIFVCREYCAQRINFRYNKRWRAALSRPEGRRPGFIHIRSFGIFGRNHDMDSI